MGKTKVELEDAIDVLEKELEHMYSEDTNHKEAAVGLNKSLKDERNLNCSLERKLEDANKEADNLKDKIRIADVMISAIIESQFCLVDEPLVVNGMWNTQSMYDADLEARRTDTLSDQMKIMRHIYEIVKSI